MLGRKAASESFGFRWTWSDYTGAAAVTLHPDLRMVGENTGEAIWHHQTDGE